MNRLARNRESYFKEIVVASNLTVVHQLRGIRWHPDEKYKCWVMPPVRRDISSIKNTTRCKEIRAICLSKGFFMTNTSARHRRYPLASADIWISVLMVLSRS